jgi:hypothetical protein
MCTAITGEKKRQVTQAISPKFSKMSWQRDKVKEKDERDQKLKSDRGDYEEEAAPHIGITFPIFIILFTIFMIICHFYNCFYHFHNYV